MSVYEHPLVVPIRRIILKRSGGNAYQALRRTFNAMDENLDKRLTRNELKNGLGAFGVTLNDQEIGSLVRLFDVDGDGKVSFDEFYAALKGPMSEARRAVVLQTYQQLPKNANGYIDALELQERYDPSQHPLVRQGVKTQNQVLTDLVRAFSRTSKDKTQVTPQEFLDYYTAVSANIEDDGLFSSIVQNAWLYGDVPKKSGVRLDAPMGDHPLASVSRPAYNPAEADAFFETKLQFEKPPAPRRVTGFTGYVVGVQETFGMTFQKIDELAQVEEKRLVQSRPPPALDDGSAQILPNPRAQLNRTTFRLE